MSCITSELCKKAITMNLEADCRNRLFSGVDSTSIIINKSDIKSVSYDVNNPNIVTSISLNSGAKAYKWINDTSNPFTGTNTSMNQNDTFQNDFTHTLSGFVLTNGTLTTREIENLANGKFVVIIENEYTGKVDGDYYHFQAYGLEKGLKATSLTSTKYENNDAWAIELSEANVPSAGKFVLNMKQDTTFSLDVDTTTEYGNSIVTYETSGGATVDAQFEFPTLLDEDTYLYEVVAKWVEGGVEYTAKFQNAFTAELTTSNCIIGVNSIKFVSETISTTPTPSIVYDNTCEMLKSLLG